MNEKIPKEFMYICCYCFYADVELCIAAPSEMVCGVCGGFSGISMDFSHITRGLAFLIDDKCSVRKPLVDVVICGVDTVFTTEACNTARDRALCANINRRCRESKNPRASSLQTLKSVNEECRRRSGDNWRDLSLCDIVRAVCVLAVIECRNVTCSGITKLVESKGN